MESEDGNSPVDEEPADLERCLLGLIKRENPSLFAVRALIKAGADISKPVSKGLTTLHYACWHQHIPTLECLLTSAEPGPEASGRVRNALNAKDEAGYTCLHLAAECGNVQAVELLLRHGADPDGCQNLEDNYANWEDVGESADGFYAGLPMAPHPVFLAMRHENALPVVEKLLEFGAEIASATATYAIKGSSTLLSAAVETRDPRLVTLLLSHNIRVNPRDMDGKTPLMTAASISSCSGVRKKGGGDDDDDSREKSLECLRLLLEAGADMNAVSWQRCGRKTALHFAVLCGSLCAVKLLIEAGVDVNAGQDNKSDPSALHLAVFRDDVEMIQLLLDNGLCSNPNAIGGVLGAPLHVACYLGADGQNRDLIVEMLLEFGADPNADVICDLDRPVAARMRSPFAEYMRTASVEGNVRHQTVAKFLACGAKVFLTSQYRDYRGILNSVRKLKMDDHSEAAIFHSLISVCSHNNMDVECARRAEASNRMSPEQATLLYAAASNSKRLQHLARTALRDGIVEHIKVKKLTDGKLKISAWMFFQSLELCPQLKNFVSFLEN
ncbi:unnamed protein product [Notodromas monacha]|uniref:Uncharacterized protein n=1 Tax=Notodromas monacha TaxID=399045 RepID=A0A7R9BL55_9CRUS|nr:unnamed protein product [Notodromas monacha]CAG0917499.1 unnamed protein product [Notodromas monacha]